MMKSDTRKTAESRPKSEACLDQTYECPAPVDEQQLKDLHIVCTEKEE